MNNLLTDRFGFSIGALIPVDGLEGETIIVFDDQIAALSSAKAVWCSGSAVKKANLPYVTVQHARWSKDGKKIFIGTGAIDVFDGSWESNPILSNIIQPNPPGMGGFYVKTASWSCDGRYVAVFMAWSGPGDQIVEPAKILVYDLLSKTPPVIVPVKNGEDVFIVNSYVVVLSPEITIWNFKGEEVAKLSPTKSIPFRFSVSIKEDYFALIDNDWSVRVVDVNNWELKATWEGHFRDIVITDQGLIALDLDGHLHAACFSDEGLKPIGIANIGILASKLAITNDGRLIIMGNGPVSVHSVDYKLNCGSQD